MIDSKQIEEGRLTAQMVRNMKQHEMVCHYTLMDEPFTSPRAESIMHPGNYLCMPTRGDFTLTLEGEGKMHSEGVLGKREGPAYEHHDWEKRRLMFEDTPYTVRTEPAEGDVLECFTIYPHRDTGMKLLHGAVSNTGRLISSSGIGIEIFQNTKFEEEVHKDRRMYLLLASMPWDARDKTPADRKLTDFDYLRFFEVDYDRDIANGKLFEFRDKDEDYRDWYYMVVTTVYPDMGGDCTENEMFWGCKVTRRQQDADSYHTNDSGMMFVDRVHIAV